MRESLMGPAGNSCRGGYLFVVKADPVEQVLEEYRSKVRPVP